MSDTGNQKSIAVLGVIDSDFVIMGTNSKSCPVWRVAHHFDPLSCVSNAILLFTLVAEDADRAIIATDSEFRSAVRNSSSHLRVSQKGRGRSTSALRLLANVVSHLEHTLARASFLVPAHDLVIVSGSVDGVIFGVDVKAPNFTI